MNEGLAELIKDRQGHVKSCRKNGDDSHKILSGLYSDRSHFIDELLQNADDAKAKEVSFELTDERLVFKHDGRKFDLNDVKSITTIGSSPKQDDVNTIGTFGAGFKSVFSVTKEPEIHSGEYHFKIVDFIVPEEIPWREEYSEKVVIILPFNHDDFPAEDVYSQIAGRLGSLKSESLLFLRNIKKIRWQAKEKEGDYSYKITGERATIVSQINNAKQSTNYSLFKKDIEIENHELNISVAYLLDNNENNKIIPVSDSGLYVFFPTKEQPRLKFLVHAPYKTTPTRESITFEDKQNQKITDELSTLIAESIDKIKAQNLLDADFLSILPIDPEEHHPLYTEAFEKVKAELLLNDLLPTSSETYVKAENALLARGKELADLLSPEDCSALFDGRKFWLNTSITEGRTSKLWNYLRDELGIPQIDMENFCKKIDHIFMDGKTDQWVIKFYSRMKENESLYRKKNPYTQEGILRQKPIIRLQDGSHVNPDNEQVYLPIDRETEYKTVKEEIAKNEEAQTFLKKLGVEEPDDIAEIKERIIPKYKKENINIDEEDYLKDWRNVFAIWEQSDKDKYRIIDLVKDAKFIKCHTPAGAIFYQRPEDVYFDSEKLKNWFEDNEDESIYFIDADLLAGGESEEFLKALGVRDEVKIQGTGDINVRKSGRHRISVNVFNPDFFIHGLGFALQNITIERSKILWDILLNYPNKLRGQIEKKTNNNYSYEKGIEQKSSVLEVLEKEYWLYDHKQQLIEKSLGEIELADLSDDYKKDDDNIDKLVKALGLKLDKIREIEEETGGKFVSADEYAEYEKWRTRDKTEDNERPSKNQTTHESWQPEVDLDEVEITEDTSAHYQHAEKDLSGQVSQTHKGGDADNGKATRSDTKTHEYESSKEIGEYGEGIAKKHLERKYPEHEVVSLNDGGIGKGYDFVIKKDGEDVFYYEVKSKVHSAPQFFEISGTQWEWAKSLHNENRGEMYKILLISNVGKKRPMLKEFSDPVALWKAGKLYADPVRIKL